MQVFELYPITPIAVLWLLGNGIADIVNSMELHGGYISSDQWCFLSADYLSRCKKRCAKYYTRVRYAVILSFFHVMPIANTVTGKMIYWMLYRRSKEYFFNNHNKIVGHIHAALCLIAQNKDSIVKYMVPRKFKLAINVHVSSSAKWSNPRSLIRSWIPELNKCLIIITFQWCKGQCNSDYIDE